MIDDVAMTWTGSRRDIQKSENNVLNPWILAIGGYGLLPMANGPEVGLVWRWCEGRVGPVPLPCQEEIVPAVGRVTVGPAAWPRP